MHQLTPHVLCLSGCTSHCPPYHLCSLPLLQQQQQRTSPTTPTTPTTTTTPSKPCQDCTLCPAPQLLLLLTITIITIIKHQLSNFFFFKTLVAAQRFSSQQHLSIEIQ
jgi:hypothetical protein